MPLERPQRLSPPAAPGALLKRPFAIARVRIKETGDRDEAYLELIRQCPCLHCGMDPCWEAAHVRMASGARGKASGAGKTPADKWALPLCGEDHRVALRAQHNIGERAFWSDIGIEPVLTCERLYAARGDLVAMRAVCFAVIGERGR
jgi:hypothetical protein